MKKSISLLLVISLIMTLLLSSCSKTPKEPVLLTMWHVYGNQTDSDMNELVDEFNKTVGKDKGITIQVTMLANSDYIHTALVDAANGVPGAGSLPDIFLAYPKTAVVIGTDLLLDWNEYFTQEEMSEYLPAFVEEGIIDGEQIVFPMAKSSEVCFINNTVFRRFSADTGYTLDDLLTWEGMFEVMEEYYNWTDEKTPNAPYDGKAFMFYDSPFNFVQFTARQLGGSFFQDDKIAFDDPIAKEAWSLWAKAAAAGHINLQYGYGTTQIMTGEALCEIGSTASIAYFSETVIYSDNTTDPLEVVVVPFPVFRDAEKSAVQRGTGLCAIAGDKAKEEAAAEFVRWFTGIEANTEFCLRMGYMPVKNAAYEAFFAGGFEQIEAADQRSLFESIAIMYRDYSFYPSPLFDDYGQLHDDYVVEMREILRPYQTAGTIDLDTVGNDTWIELENRLGG
ncbi:MAG: extracellular solute-binding protein [Oscillospiraceae bacterium]|nr:extracellular solute-binding protein [Oscillospiraceae bacterium]